ncbi:MAG: antitoxin Xre/MbcA/ParS toxin-binding domain-containing protein [Thermoanaerobaculia bacterium]
MARVAASRRVPPQDDVARFVEFARSGGPGRHAHAILLGLRDFDSAAVLRAVERGFSFKTLERFQHNVGLTQTQVASLLQIAQRTLTRRRDEGRLSPGESDRLLRASRVFGRALELFDGDTRGARQWLASPQPAVGGAVPLALAETEVGAREVEAAIGRIEHGVYA